MILDPAPTLSALRALQLERLKEQIAQMACIHLGVTKIPGPLDVSDAAAIALTRLADARLEEAMAR